MYHVNFEKCHKDVYQILYIFTGIINNENNFVLGLLCEYFDWVDFIVFFRHVG